MMHAQHESVASLTLLGCVKSKLSSTMAAKNLYDSPLWQRLRAYAERSAVHSHTSSANHPPLALETRIAAFDVTYPTFRRPSVEHGPSASWRVLQHRFQW